MFKANLRNTHAKRSAQSDLLNLKIKSLQRKMFQRKLQKRTQTAQALATAMVFPLLVSNLNCSNPFVLIDIHVTFTLP